MTQKKKSDKENFNKDACTARGHILESCIKLELLIDFYIAKHFSDDKIKNGELLNLILSAGRITFENKRLVFKFLIEKYNPAFVKSYPQFHTDLGKIIEHRNLFAHYSMDITSVGMKNYEKGYLGFLKFRNQAKSIRYSKAEINKIIHLVSEYTQAVAKLIW